ncbi:MAG: hypothetical protein QOH06_3614 [Acidobacteriota bacterium]|nr:hypothetical protein [Acidobacteriota bacterium]
MVQVLEETGFVRTLGGSDIYLALRARIPGMRREDLEAVVEAHEAQIVPAVRGCMYLVPRRDVPLALRMADVVSRSRHERDQEKAGIRSGEVEEVGKAVLETLRERGPLTTDALRKALPAGTVRSLGEVGKKVGISSPLPGALRMLEFDGHVERTLEGRLDSERYRWRAAARSPLEGVQVPEDPIDLFAGMARIFFQAAGLGTIKDFAGWAGISQRDAKAAIEKIGVLPVIVEGDGEVHYLIEERRLEESADAVSAVAFLPFEDNLIHLHGGPARVVDEAHHAMTVPIWGSSKTTTIGEARHMSLRSVVAEGKVSGFWEFDPDAREVVYRGFDGLSAATRKKLDAAAQDLSHFLAEDLGHGRSFTLDTDEELRKRSVQVRGM